MAACALLVACGAPVVPPALDVALDTTSVAVVRGASAEVQVTLARLGGAGEPVDLSVVGLPANVTATFSPDTLDGATLTSTLTIDAAPAAADAVTDLTVVATSGTLSDDAALSLTVTSLTVTGRIEGPARRPFGGVTVGSQGETDITDGAGAFTLTGLSIPYDLTLGSAAGDGGLHVYEGMTSATPLLRPTFAFGGPALPATGFGSTVTGSFLGGALGVDEVVAVCVEGLASAVYGCDTVAAAATGYAINAAWFDGAAVAVRLHAFHVEVDADDVPVAYLGYETFGLDLNDGVGVVADLDFDPVDSANLAGTAAFPASITNTGLLVAARFGPNLSMRVLDVEHAGGAFEVLVPVLPGVSYDVLVGGIGATDAVYTWKHDIGLDAGALAVAEPAQPVEPLNGVAGVDLTTPFTSTAVGGARTYVWAPDGAGPVLSLTTTRTAVTIPDPASAGVALPSPAGLAYGWRIVGHGDADVETAALGGYADLTYFAIAFSDGGGPGFDGDRTLSFQMVDRDFTFAP